MLSRKENERFTRVGPGTPAGEFLRRYWQPVCVAAELKENPIKRIRILGEDLVLYRGEDGHYGLVEERCPHRGASLAYGRIEGANLRCSYHGWLFDRQGRCLEQPAEPPASTYKNRVRQPLIRWKNWRVSSTRIWAPNRRRSCQDTMSWRETTASAGSSCFQPWSAIGFSRWRIP